MEKDKTQEASEKKLKEQKESSKDPKIQKEIEKRIEGMTKSLCK